MPNISILLGNLGIIRIYALQLEECWGQNKVGLCYYSRSMRRILYQVFDDKDWAYRIRIVCYSVWLQIYKLTNLILYDWDPMYHVGAELKHLNLYDASVVSQSMHNRKFICKQQPRSCGISNEQGPESSSDILIKNLQSRLIYTPSAVTGTTLRVVCQMVR